MVNEYEEQHDEFSGDGGSSLRAAVGGSGSSSSHHRYYNAGDLMDEKSKKRVSKGFIALSALVVLVVALGLLALVIISIVLYWTRGNKRFYPNPEYSSSSDYIHFLVVGDQGRGNDEQKTVAASMGKYCESTASVGKLCQFIVGVGDNIYENGVTDMYDQQFKTKFEDVYSAQPGLKDLKWYMMLGNHDYRSNPEAQIQYSQINSRWVMPDYFYSFEKISTERNFNVSFVVTDTNPMIKGYFSKPAMNQTALDSRKANNTDQLSMIENILQQNFKKPDKWTLVFGHHPVYSAGVHYNTPELLDTYEPLFDRYKLPLYMSGHDHLLNWLSNPAIPYTQYVVSGGGSGNTKPVLYNPNSLNELNDSGFFSIEIQYSFIFARAFDKNGKEIWKFRINKPN